MMQSPIGIQMLIDELQRVQTAVETEGELTDAAIDGFLGSEKPDPISFQLKKLRTQFLANPDGIPPSEAREKYSQQVLSYLDRELSYLRSKIGERQEREKTREQAREAAALLLSRENMEKIPRYEGAHPRIGRRPMATTLARRFEGPSRYQRLRRNASNAVNAAPARRKLPGSGTLATPLICDA